MLVEAMSTSAQLPMRRSEADCVSLRTLRGCHGRQAAGGGRAAALLCQAAPGGSCGSQPPAVNQ